MQIEYVQGDLLETDIPHIIHGCNAQGRMASGVAKLIRAKYPKAYSDYMNVYDNVGLSVGMLIQSEQPDGKTIYNAITQRFYGTDKSVVYVSYWAVAEVMRQLNGLGIKKIAMPMLGAGLANGDWKVISAIIENTLTNVQPVVYVI